MPTNNEWAVPMGMDDRRVCVVDVPSTFVNNHDYLKKIRHELLNGGYEAMLHDLLAYDLSTFNHRKPPKTAAGLKQKLQGLTPTQRWWFDKLNAGRLLPLHEGWRREVSRTELHDNYVLVLQKAGVSRRATETELAKQVRDHLCPQVTTMRRVMEVRAAEDKEGRPRFEKRNERCWVLPNLAECRKLFEQLMTQAIEWEPVDETSVGDPDPKLYY